MMTDLEAARRFIAETSLTAQSWAATSHSDIVRDIRFWIAQHYGATVRIGKHTVEFPPEYSDWQKLLKRVSSIAAEIRGLFGIPHQDDFADMRMAEYRSKRQKLGIRDSEWFR